jgi:hypothetical protein
MKALVAAVLAVLGCVGCSGASDALGSAHGGDPTKGGDEGRDAQAAPQSEAGPTDDAAADAGSYCFAPGAVCDPAKGAEPGIACCEGSCSATTGLCSVPTDGGVAHQDAGGSLPDAGTPSDDAGFWIADASSPDCDASTCSINGTTCINDQAAGCRPDEAATQAGVCNTHPGTIAFACKDSSLLPSFVWNATICSAVGIPPAGTDGVCCPQAAPNWTMCSANDCYALGTCR